MVDLVSNLLHFGEVATDAVDAVNVKAFRLDLLNDHLDKERIAAALSLTQTDQIRSVNTF